MRSFVKYFFVAIVGTVVAGPGRADKVTDCPPGKWECLANGQVVRVLNGGIRGTTSK